MLITSLPLLVQEMRTSIDLEHLAEFTAWCDDKGRSKNEVLNECVEHILGNIEKERKRVSEIERHANALRAAREVAFECDMDICRDCYMESTKRRRAWQDKMDKATPTRDVAIAEDQWFNEYGYHWALHHFYAYPEECFPPCGAGPQYKPCTKWGFSGEVYYKANWTGTNEVII